MIERNYILAEDVCAFLWSHADQESRLGACAAAGLPHKIAPMHWRDIHPAERTRMAAELADEIQITVGKQRLDRADVTTEIERDLTMRWSDTSEMEMVASGGYATAMWVRLHNELRGASTFAKMYGDHAAADTLTDASLQALARGAISREAAAGGEANGPRP